MNDKNKLLITINQKFEQYIYIYTLINFIFIFNTTQIVRDVTDNPKKRHKISENWVVMASN